MTEPKTHEAVPVAYPPYLIAQPAEDEIDLIDLWLRLRRYQRVFWPVFLVILLLGAGYALFLYQEKHNLNTAIQIGSINTGSQVVKLESTESLKGKLSNALVPALTARYMESHPDLGQFKTEVSSPKNSDIVLIRNKITDDGLPVFTAYQKDLAAAVLEDHRKLIELYRSELLSKLQEEQAKLAILLDPRTLETLLQPVKLQIATEEQKLAHLQENRKILQTGGKEAVLRSMTDEQKQWVLNRKGTVDDRLLDARYQEVLLNSRIQQDEQQQAIEATRLKLNEVQLEHERKIEAQRRKVAEVQAKIDAYNVTRVVSEPVKSIQVAGLSRNALLGLLVFLAGFVGFMAMLVALFRDRIREKAEEQR